MNNATADSLHQFFKECFTVAESKGWHENPPTAPASDVEYALANRALDLLDFAAVVESLRKPGVSDSLPGAGMTTQQFREKINAMAPERIKLVGKLILIATEAAEAIEHVVLAEPGDDIVSIKYNEKGAPDGVAIELADVIIRAGDDSVDFGLPLIQAILIKMAYNATRPYKHGKLV